MKEKKINDVGYIYKFKVEIDGLEKGSQGMRDAFRQLEERRPEFVQQMNNLEAPEFYEEASTDRTFVKFPKTQKEKETKQPYKKHYSAPKPKTK